MVSEAPHAPPHPDAAAGGVRGGGAGGVRGGDGKLE